ncbi:hypothetical protein K501DRAFT_333328 [Backusella circina FSU 941]|nr:hypothetical protein K501DRAFT_333328 [Backusella circina FSU 941]
MYAQMSHSHYGGVPSSPYHYDRSLSVSSHEYPNTTSSPINAPHPTSHPNDPYGWYSEPAGISVPSHKTMSHHYPLLFSPVPNNNTRPVIPSKRAAQNRAAQRAFRLRKERYVKDLEQKAKLMEDMQTELDQLRKENQMLKNNTLQLEEHIKGIKQEDAPLPPQLNQQQQQNKKNRKTHNVSPIQVHFQPVSLRAPDQTVGFGSPTTSCSSNSSNDNWNQVPDFEPYECVSHCDQRSEMSPFVMVPPYPIMHNNNNMLMSRNY